jgi:hypothetical protein
MDFCPTECTCHICAAELLILQSAMLFFGLTLPVFTEMYDLQTSYLCVMILIFLMLFASGLFKLYITGTEMFSSLIH